MKKFLLLVVAFCFLGIGAQAQSTMGKGQLVGGVRLGLNGGGVPVGLVLDYGVAGGLINGNASISVASWYSYFNLPFTCFSTTVPPKRTVNARSLL